MTEPSQPRVSVVIPVYNEGDAIVGCLDRIFAGITLPCEVLVVAFPEGVMEEDGEPSE